jgi:hypothetical protein
VAAEHALKGRGVVRPPKGPEQQRARPARALGGQQDPGAMRSMLASAPGQSEMLMSLQASHGNAAVQELLSPLQREAAVATHGQKAAKHRPEHKAGPHVENPTYRDALDYARDYFTREGEKENVLADLKDNAVHKFEGVTGKAFNTQAPGGLEILWGCLQIVPTAGPLLHTFGELKDGAKIFVTIKEYGEKVKKLEEVTKSAEPFVKGYELAKKGSEATEEHEGAAYVIEKINSLDELRVADVGARWDKEDAIKKLLKDHRYASSGTDLMGQVAGQLGPIADSAKLKEAAGEVRTKFELALYADFYRKRGAKFIISTMFIVGEFVDGIPDEAKSYIKTLGHFGSDRELASAFRLPILSTDGSVKKPRPDEII